MAQTPLIRRGLNALLLYKPFVEIRALLDVLRRTNIATGDTEAVTGAATATVLDLTNATVIELTTATADGVAVNDFDLPAGFHGQEVLVKLAALGNAGDTATLTEKAGVTVVQSDGTTAFASATFATVAEYVHLRFEVDKWRILAATATIA